MTVKDLILALLRERASNETYQQVNRIFINDSSEGLDSEVMVDETRDDNSPLTPVISVSSEGPSITWLRQDDNIPF